MSGPIPPGSEPEKPDFASELSADFQTIEGSGHGLVAGGGVLQPLDDSVEAGRDLTSQTDAYSRAYSAPESEQFTSGPYLPVDLRLYDYDDYVDYGDYGASEPADERIAPRWPWVVGVTAILAAIALVVSVSLLVTRTGSHKLATPATTQAAPPFQDEITTTPPPPPLPPPPPTPLPATEIPTATETHTVTVTPTAAPPPPEVVTTTAPPQTTTTPAGPRQVTYSVTGTKAPGDIISVTYVDASGRRRTQHNVYIPWSMTVTPISQSEVGSVEASSLFRVSKLNCSITTSDGTVLSSNTNDAPQTSC